MSRSRWLGRTRRCRPCFVRPRAHLSGGELPAPVLGEAEVDEALEVDGGGSVGEPDAVAGEAAVGDASAGSDEPGEAAFDHWSELSVVAVAPGSAGFDEFGVVVIELEDPSVAGGGAARSDRAVAAVSFEDRVVRRGERDGVSRRAGDGSCGVVDDEVVASEAAGVGGRPGLDRQPMSALVERCSGLAGAVGGVGATLDVVAVQWP